MPGYQNKVGGIVTQFSDSFARGTLNPSGLLPWEQTIMAKLPISTPFNVGGYTCNGTNLVASSFGQDAPTYTMPAVLRCSALTYRLVSGQTQHCKCTFIAQNAVANSSGPSVLTDVQGVPSSNGGCYGILVIGAGACRLVKMTGGSSTWVENDLVAPIPGITLVNGSIMRISAQVNPGSVFLTVTINGVVATTFTDNTPLLTGVPGFFESSISQSAGVPGQVTFGSLQCGLGL